ncbi:type ISP restriction/modification enzyme [Xylanibacter brevis]|uniref:type ISP restriction/modification enzyme n=1 Tax=Xylanibacter brevis TaxID=83231 RepID=UPI0004840A1F|nr:type ISP restriction/modification enzyme [Xylanibacter brevis]
MKTESLKLYIDELNKQYRTGIAREHSYRPALKDLLQSLLPKMVVTNEPAHFECGAPDYIIQREKDHLPVFFVEAKDVNDNDLDGRNKNGHKEQFDRYKQALDYIIFTDYLDFHLYEHGEFVDSVRIAETKGDKIVGIADAEDKFIGMIQHLGASAIQRITSAPRLAKLMAGKARLLANIIETAMNDETHSYENDNLRGQYQAFKDVLIQELKPEDFADIYAQTIAYGMFAARLHDDTPEDFSREEAARLIPKTNPFLRQIFNNLAGNDLDERIAWVVDDLVTVFQATNLQKIMASYSRDKLHHDPMIHFYEDFLSEYNPKLRKSKGVWYTPQPVVGFIVRAVDEILQKEFGLPEGLADYSMIEREVAVEQSRDRRTTDGMKHEKRKFHRVQILDPATGTGTFLAEVVNQIYDRYRDNQGIWQQYVEQHLLPRLNGFEILMASYAVAHIKLDMLLGETGYQHQTDKRLHVYLTNSLEESNNEPRTLFAQWLSREATEANVIKRDYPVMVMIGNPPYSGESQNKGKWIMSLMESYKKEPGGKSQLNERNPKWLNDDYVKFIRLAQDYIEKNGEGIIGFINPHGYLDNPTFRGMRWNLLKTFDKIFTIDLHGNSKKKETCPDGSKDENVFDIMQGVSINLFVKTGKKSKDELGKVYHKDMYGLRQNKYDFLDEATIENVGYKELKPKEPMYFFVPKDFELQEEYDKGFKIDELFKISSVSVVTANDSVLVDINENNLLKKVNEAYGNADKSFVERYNYRPFDDRYIYYDVQKIERPRESTMRHMKKPNIAILTCRQLAGNEWLHVSVADGIVDDCRVSSKTKERGYVFPLYIYKENMGKEECIVNFNKELYDNIAKGLNYLPCYDDNILIDPTSEYNGVLYPKDLFDYNYAVLHSPSYRERYKEFLKIDFPRIPYPTDWEKYRDLVEKGEELRQLHLMEDLPHSTGVSFPVGGSLQVDCYRWEKNRIYINSEQFFEGVSESAWNFYIGGYQPAQKWLKDRKGLTLSFEDVKHYQRIIYVLQQTERMMKEIDELLS